MELVRRRSDVTNMEAVGGREEMGVGDRVMVGRRENSVEEVGYPEGRRVSGRGATGGRDM